MSDAPQPARFLATLRDPEAPPAEREEAWGLFVRWLYEEHWAPSLEARLLRRIEGQGLAAHLAPGDVLTRFCFRVRERPEILGERPVPTRTWLRKAIEFECRELEKSARRQERARLQPRSAEEMERLLDGAAPPVPVGSPDPRSGFLGSPEAAVLLRELQEELARELEKLGEENPAQLEALRMKDEGSPYREIGAKLSTSVGNVKSMVSRAREKLRARLAAYLSSEGSTDEPR